MDKSELTEAVTFLINTGTLNELITKTIHQISVEKVSLSEPEILANKAWELYVAWNTNKDCNVDIEVCFNCARMFIDQTPRLVVMELTHGITKEEK